MKFSWDIEILYTAIIYNTHGIRKESFQQQMNYTSNILIFYVVVAAAAAADDDAENKRIAKKIN